MTVDPTRWKDDPEIPSELRDDLATATHASRSPASYGATEGLARFESAVANAKGGAVASGGAKMWVLGAFGAAIVAGAIVYAMSTSKNVQVTPTSNPPEKQAIATIAPPPITETTAPVVVTGAIEPALVPTASHKAPGVAAPSSSADAIAAELAQLANLRAVVAGDPAKAITLAKEGDVAFPHGLMHQEREAIAIEALARVGRRDEAHARAADFLSRYASGPYAERVRAVIDGAKIP